MRGLAVVFIGSFADLRMFEVNTDHTTTLQLSALHMAGQPICDQLTFCFGSARSKVPGHATSSFGPEMCGRDLMLHYSSDGGLPGALMGALGAFAYVVSNATIVNSDVAQKTSLLLKIRFRGFCRKWSS